MSQSVRSLESETKMDEPLLAAGRPSSEVASVQERRRTTAAASRPAGQRRSVAVGAGPNWTLCRLGSTADCPSAGPATAAMKPAVFKSDIYIDCLILSIALQLSKFPGLWAHSVF